MKTLITIFIVGSAIWGLSQLVKFYEKSRENSIDRPRPVQAATNPDDELPPLPPALEASLKTAMAAGALTMREWLDANRIYIQDPRRAAIELDYAQLLSRSDPIGAKLLYQQVKSRNPQGAAVAARLQRLAKIFE
jgi:hypothetical protein